MEVHGYNFIHRLASICMHVYTSSLYVSSPLDIFQQERKASAGFLFCIRFTIIKESKKSHSFYYFVIASCRFFAMD